MAKVDLFLAKMDEGVSTATFGDAVKNLLDNEKDTKLELLNERGQAVATIASVSQIVFPRAGPVFMFASSQVAASITLTKITADFVNDRGIKGGDVLSLVGNVSGTVLSVATIAFSATAPGRVLLALGVASGLGSIVVDNRDVFSDLIRKIYQMIDGESTEKTVVDYYKLYSESETRHPEDNADQGPVALFYYEGNNSVFQARVSTSTYIKHLDNGSGNGASSGSGGSDSGANVGSTVGYVDIGNGYESITPPEPISGGSLSAGSPTSGSVSILNPITVTPGGSGGSSGGGGGGGLHEVQ